MQINNNLQVLWNSKVKFVSLSQLLGCPLFGTDSGPFTALFYCLTFAREGGGRKKKKKKPPVGFQPAKPVLLVFLAGAV